MEYIYQEFDNCFWVYSDLSDVWFVVEVNVPSMTEEAKEIANREIEYWLDPEESPDPDYYRESGYVEVVKNALLKQGIPADYYVKEDD